MESADANLSTTSASVEPFRVLHVGSGRVGKGLRIVTYKDGEEILCPIITTTLDRDANLDPDLLCDLGRDAIRADDDTFDLIVAIHVLEHIGRQGETDEWFRFWEEAYRVLKPGGRLQFESPLWTSVWGWGDPSHTRVLSEQAFYFFNQDSYRIKGSPISPYRIKCDFVPHSMERIKDTLLERKEREYASNLKGVLTARKPLRPWWEDAS